MTERSYVDALKSALRSAIRRGDKERALRIKRELDRTVEKETA
jgi:hypothetical protein